MKLFKYAYIIFQKTQSNEQNKNKITSIKFEILKIESMIFKGCEISPNKMQKVTPHVKIINSIQKSETSTEAPQHPITTQLYTKLPD
jgi:hypothetical protein